MFNFFKEAITDISCSRSKITEVKRWSVLMSDIEKAYSSGFLNETQFTVLNEYSKQVMMSDTHPINVSSQTVYYVEGTKDLCTAKLSCGLGNIENIEVLETENGFTIYAPPEY